MILKYIYHQLGHPLLDHSGHVSNVQSKGNMGILRVSHNMKSDLKI